MSSSMNENDAQILLKRVGIPATSVKSRDADNLFIIRFSSAIDNEIMLSALQETAARNHTTSSAQMTNDTKQDISTVSLTKNEFAAFMEYIKNNGVEKVVDLKRAKESAAKETTSMSQSWGKKTFSKRYGRFTVTELTTAESKVGYCHTFDSGKYAAKIGHEAKAPSTPSATRLR